ncbi:DUF2924 domain-containing protein [Roseovarius arcticus]|uniref:DUF2924 domain-containing protein n=1 Tax=Roseovarius arcticus TaxID=2547404 RepID=UPI001110F8F4|nr:DUF2924 domain-containing protein [Roseovarius arcticus]
MPHDPILDRRVALAKWEATFGSPPPPHLSVAFLRKAVVYAGQCKAHGGLSAASRRALRAVVKGTSAGAAPVASLRSGTQLVREWNGRTYQVQVIENGFELDGRTWASLSAIAKHITGATWSGPRFFGLTRRIGGKP